MINRLINRYFSQPYITYKIRKAPLYKIGQERYQNVNRQTISGHTLLFN